jgi:hypothetical protein
MRKNTFSTFHRLVLLALGVLSLTFSSCQDDQESKAKPIGKSPKNRQLLPASLTALLPFMLFTNAVFLVIIPAVLMINYLFWFRRQFFQISNGNE